jgi:hypothetical protein
MTFDRDEYDFGALGRTTPTNEQFADAARQPDEWINAARPLRVGAYVLNKSRSEAERARATGAEAIRPGGLLFTSLFLASLSLENVLKAVLFVRRPELASNGKLHFGGSGHDLVLIAGEARFVLEEHEENFLRVSCNPCITDFGRYRIPMRAANGPAVYQFHTGAFRFFESIFMRGVDTALREACDRPSETRTAEFKRLLSDVRNDVPPWIMFA